MPQSKFVILKSDDFDTNEQVKRYRRNIVRGTGRHEAIDVFPWAANAIITTEFVGHGRFGMAGASFVL